MVLSEQIAQATLPRGRGTERKNTLLADQILHRRGNRHGDCKTEEQGFPRDARAQGGKARQRFRKKGEEPQAGDRHRDVGIRAIAQEEERGNTHQVEQLAQQGERLGQQGAHLAEQVETRLIGSSFTPRAKQFARDVLIATNAYSGRLTPWTPIRPAPISAFMITTEPVSDNLAKSILPVHTYTANRRSVPREGLPLRSARELQDRASLERGLHRDLGLFSAHRRP